MRLVGALPDSSDSPIPPHFDICPAPLPVIISELNLDRCLVYQTFYGRFVCLLLRAEVQTATG